MVNKNKIFSTGVAHILAADIGGSNARFAHFSLKDGSLRLHNLQHVFTASLANMQDVLDVAAQTGLAMQDAHAVIFAVAGPLLQPHVVTLTNAHLTIDIRPLAEQGIPAAILNDFVAQAWASLTQPGEQALGIHTAVPIDPLAPRAFVGAGTGLGTAMLLAAHDSKNTTQPRWQARAAEAGHTLFAFVGKEEHDYATYLQGVLGTSRITCEHVLSGRGLVRLHHYITGQDAPAREISAQHLTTATGATTPTAQWFSRMYGRVCRHIALHTLCTGGLYVTGGIAAGNSTLIQSPYFMEEFLCAPKNCAQLLQSIPLWLMQHSYAGLWGAARAGQEYITCYPA